MINALEVVADSMNALNLNYAFMEWKDEPKYPYFVGEYQEIETYTEDGQQEGVFILKGFTRGNWAELEAARQKIEKYFHKINGHIVTTQSSAVAIFYANSLVIPTGDAELKRVEINLTIKEWMVE